MGYIPSHFDKSDSQRSTEVSANHWVI